MTDKTNFFSNTTEEEIKKYWTEKEIPKKVRTQKKSKNYYFIDGPPYASGAMHVGTAMNRILKDFFIRYYRMQDYYILDTPGFDTHGVPIEIKVQKKYDLKSKEDIEKFGIDKFTEECKVFATKHISDMCSEIYNLGQWMDFENPYRTLDNNYMKTGWWSFKKAVDKGLLYHGIYPVHVCSKCETSVSFNEIEHEDLTDQSIFVAVESKEEDDLYYVIWTTTPWTLPANLAIMVHPKYIYIEIINNENNKKYIVAKELAEKLVAEFKFSDYSFGKEYLGEDLKDKKYKPIMSEKISIPEENTKNAYKIVLAPRYVHLEDGTGLVHCAPGHGKEDYEIGTENNIKPFCPVKINGTYDETVVGYVGQNVKDTDPQIINFLKEKEVLLSQAPITHAYPTCWRCHTPLLQVALPQWFLKITDIKERLIEINRKEVNWYPVWAKERFHDWLNTISDWPISRSRYWGIPIPIWQCESCKQYEVFGSIEELKEKVPSLDVNMNIHKPFIDTLTYTCEKCGGVVKRIPEVFDVWYDSAIASWASIGYPHNKEKFEQFWPPNLNIEGSDQIRGWWNSQLIISTICFDKAPFKFVALHGMVLDVDKKKLSKSLGNDKDLSVRFKEFSIDYYRYYFAKEYSGVDLVIDEKKFKEIKRIFNLLENIFNFLKIYQEKQIFTEYLKPSEENLTFEDKWILSKLNNLIKKSHNYYKGALFSKLVQDIETFILEDFSRIYIKLIRKREVKNNVLTYVYSQLLLLLSPIAPHFTEYMYLQFENKQESIHLLNISQEEESLIDNDLEKNFDLTQEIIQTSLSLREKMKFRLRWVLPKLYVSLEDVNKIKPFKETLEKMVNVKEVVFEEPKEDSQKETVKDKVYVYLLKNVPENYKEEWELSELTRLLQSERKNQKLVPSQIVDLNLSSDDKDFLEKNKQTIEQATSTKITVVDFNKDQAKTLIERKVTFSF
jgi:isoleucyl-tRNA synthetase